MFPTCALQEEHFEEETGHAGPYGRCDADLEEHHFCNFFFKSEIIMELEIWRIKDETMDLICIIFTNFCLHISDVNHSQTL